MKNRQLVSDMAWNTFGNIIYCICQWIITILVVRFASYEEAGYLGLAMTTTSTFATISLFNMRNYQVSDVKNEFSPNEYVGSRILTTTFAVICCLFSGFHSKNFYQMICINAFMLIRIAESFADVLHGVDQKYGRYDLIGKSYVIRGLLTVSFFTVIIAVTNSAAFAIIAIRLTNLFAVFFFDLRKTSRLSKIKPVLWNSGIRLLLIKCVPLVLISFVLSLIPLTAKQSLQNILGTDNLGKYSSIASPTLIVQVFASYAFNPLIPRISVMFMEERYSDFRLFLKRILVFFFCFSVIVFCGAIIFGRLGLKILYGAEILEYYDAFYPLVGCTILTAYSWIMMAIVTVIRGIIPMMVGIVLSYLTVYFFADGMITCYGMNGASMIQLLGYSAFLLFLIIYTFSVISRKEKIGNEE